MIYDESYFIGNNMRSPNPAGYGNYAESAYIVESADARAEKLLQILKLKNVFDSSKAVLVLGCAYGYLVKAFRSFGVAAYGLDISGFAVAQAADRLIIVGDAADYRSYRRVQALSKCSKFMAVVDENMLCCLSDEQAIKLCGYSRLFADVVIHLVKEEQRLKEFYNYHPIKEWLSVVGVFDNELWYGLYTWKDGGE